VRPRHPASKRQPIPGPGLGHPQPRLTRELAAQDPVELTEGPWRFFVTSAEESALYDFAFFDDGTFHESGATHNAGTYSVNGQTITMSLTRVDTGEASDAVNTRTDDQG
jgi:hypothetical protein